MKRLQIEVPATSANLGPGLDCLGLALDLVDTLTVDLDPDGTETCLEAPAEVALDRHENLVCRAYRAWAEDVGIALPAASFRLESRIPIGKGFGSSAASIVAGLAAAAAAADAKDATDAAPRLLRLAAQIEGHADNTTAAILGGVTVSIAEGDEIQSLNVINHSTLGVVLFVPEAQLPTSKARALLPDSVPRADALFNASRTAFLVTALMWARPELLGPAMEDRLHQRYRSAVIPALDTVIRAAREAGAYGAALSGGGPSVIAFCNRAQTGVLSGAMEDAARSQNWPGASLVTSIRHSGVQVKTLE